MTYTLTTPLYYVNDKPHLGSAYTTLACDSIARFKRLQKERVIFVTGVDEHGQKIQATARSKNMSPKAHCDQISYSYKELWQKYGITNDKFIRTTSSIHKEFVEEFFNRVQETGDIYLGHQEGWYCVGCEEYKDVSSDTNSPICDIHRKELEWRDEENLFFRLSKYQKPIQKLVEKDGFISPSTRRNEIINFVKGGLNDFSISRVNVSWGLSVPGYQGHTFYVWFDALLGYISSLLDNDVPVDFTRLSEHGWPASIHVIGKDILRFHAVYWPAILMSANLPLPKAVFGHGFLTREGMKMGKSLGNILDPVDLIDQYGIDSLRWYLLKDIEFGKDGDFQQRRFIDLVNNDLANTIGNLLNRTSSMSRKWFDNSIPPYNKDICDKILSNNAKDMADNVIAAMTKLDFRRSAEAILDFASLANNYLNDNAPWSLIKDQNNTERVANNLYSVLESCRFVGVVINPLLPDFSFRLLNQLDYKLNINDWHESLIWGTLKSGSPLPVPSPIMQKIDI